MDGIQCIIAFAHKTKYTNSEQNSKTLILSQLSLINITCIQYMHKRQGIQHEVIITNLTQKSREQQLIY